MRVWTEEQRQKQRDAIKKWAPWKSATGPKSISGKKISCMNALKHGGRCAGMRRMGNFNRRHRQFLKPINSYTKLMDRYATRKLAIIYRHHTHHISARRANELLSALPPPPPYECFFAGVWGKKIEKPPEPTYKGP